MGWLFGWYSRRELVEHLLQPFGSDDKRHVTSPIAHCFKGNNMWSVWERTDTSSKVATLAPGIEARVPVVEKHRYIVVFLLRRNGSPAEWGYKDVSEDMGPCEINCPLSYLDMAPLDADSRGYQVEWRERVKAYWAKRAAGREVAKKLVRGQMFRSHGTEYYFIEQSSYQKKYVIAENAVGERYRIKKENIELVPVASEAGVALEAGGQPA